MSQGIEKPVENFLLHLLWFAFRELEQVFVKKNCRSRMFLFALFDLCFAMEYLLLKNRLLKRLATLRKCSKLEVYNTCRGLHLACTAYAGGDW